MRTSPAAVEGWRCPSSLAVGFSCSSFRSAGSPLGVISSSKPESSEMGGDGRGNLAGGQVLGHTEAAAADAVGATIVGIR